MDHTQKQCERADRIQRVQSIPIVQGCAPNLPCSFLFAYARLDAEGIATAGAPPSLTSLTGAEGSSLIVRSPRWKYRSSCVTTMTHLPRAFSSGSSLR